MRIIDKNTDFYDYWQTIYPDDTFTFDRTDSFLLTKDIFCKHLSISTYQYKYIKNYKPCNFVLLQVCNTFWLFLVEITKETSYGTAEDYTIELLTTWKNYNKLRCLLKLDVISFDWNINSMLYHDEYNKINIRKKIDILVQAINTDNFHINYNFNKHTIYMGDDAKIEKHIPLLKACRISNCIDSLEIFLALEEYFSLEKTSSEKITSIGLTNDEKIENHGFNVKTSFRGNYKL